MKRDEELVLELCKFVNPNPEKIKELLQSPYKEPVVLGYLLFNRMGGVAYYTLKECQLLGLVNREFRNVIKNMYDVGVEQSKVFQYCLSDIAHTLHHLDFPYAFLKGAYLNSIYPEGLRTSNDIDILLDRKHISDISVVLKEQGYMQGNIRNGMFIPATRAEIVHSLMNRGETVPFIKEINLPKCKYCEIDLNFSMDFKGPDNPDMIHEFLNHTQLLKPDDIKVFSQTDHMIHLCLHLYKEATTMAWVSMNRDLSLYKFCDIYLLLNQWGTAKYFKELLHRIQNMHVEKECYYAFRYTKVLFNIKNPYLDRLIFKIRPSNTEYMKEVFDPAENKVYRHNQSLRRWFFNMNRKDDLYEIADV